MLFSIDNHVLLLIVNKALENMLQAVYGIYAPSSAAIPAVHSLDIMIISCLKVLENSSSFLKESVGIYIPLYCVFLNSNFILFAIILLVF